MNYLCVCQYGHSRSVALARRLHSRGHQAVPVGYGTSPGALPVLCEWADQVLVLQAVYAQYIPATYAWKVHIVDVGPDRWVNPYHKELNELLERLLAEKGLG